MNPEAALKRVVAGSRKAFMAVGLFSLAINLLMLVVPIYMMQMYDRVITSGNVDTLLLLTAIAVFALLTMSLVEMMRSRIMVRLGAWVDRTLSGPVLAGGMNDSLRAGGLTGASGLRELNTLRGFLTGAGVFPLLDAPWVPLFVGVIFLVHPTLGWLAVGGAVIVFMFALANDLWTRDPLKKANGAATRALYRADAMVRNADVAAAMGMEPYLVRRWRDSNEEGLRLQALASDRAGGISAMAKFVRLALQIGMLGTGAYLVTQGEISGGAMIAGSIILSRAMAPIEQSINAWRGMIAAKGAYENIKKLLERTPATGDAMSLPRPDGRLSIEGVGFVPPGGSEPILRGVSLEIKAGECIGLIGASASGKTTLARILVGSWRPSAGHARLDGADVYVWEAADRGRYIGYLPQDVELFDGPVRENIARMGEPDADAVIAAAEAAGVHELILRLPQAYETMIGDGGARLSGGQRQRIALARALYGDPALVVLDEPNSNLDTEGEQALMEALAALKERGTTTVVVAHRPSVLASVDRLVVMHQGRIEMEGPRDEILAKVAPGSLDAVRRAEIAEHERALKNGAAGAVEIDGAAVDPDDAEPPPGATAPPAPEHDGATPVFRIRPGAASRPAATPGNAGPDTTIEDTSAPKQTAAETTTVKPEAEPKVDDAAAAKTPTSRRGVGLKAAIVAEDADIAADAPAGSGPAAVDKKDLKSLFDRITATSPPPSAEARANGEDRQTPAAEVSSSDSAAPKDEASNNAAPASETAANAAAGRKRRPLHRSPTAPGALFPSGGGPMTGDARPGRIPPRREREDD